MGVSEAFQGICTYRHCIRFQRAFRLSDELHRRLEGLSTGVSSHLKAFLGVSEGFREVLGSFIGSEVSFTGISKCFNRFHMFLKGLQSITDVLSGGFSGI